MAAPANPHRGEVAFDLSDDIAFTARPTFALIAGIETNLGSILTLAAKARATALSVSECVVIIALAAAATEGEKYQKKFKGEPEFREAIFACGMAKILPPVVMLLNNALSTGRPEKNGEQAAKPRK